MHLFKKITFVVLCSMTFLLHVHADIRVFCYEKNSHAIHGGYQCTGNQIPQHRISADLASYITVGCIDKDNHSYIPFHVKATKNGTCSANPADRESHSVYRWLCLNGSGIYISQIECKNHST